MTSKQPEPTCEWVESQLEALALGELEGEEAAVLRAHLSRCESCRAQFTAIEDTLSALAGAASPVAPPADLWERVEAHVDTLGAAGESTAAEFTTAEFTAAEFTATELSATELTIDEALDRARALPWTDTPFPGLSIKVLEHNPESQRWAVLTRLAAGASFPAHDHRSAEVLEVVEGELQFEDRTLAAGERVSHAAGTRHGVASSPAGCTVLVHGSALDWIPA